MFAWLAHFIERHPYLHRASLAVWRLFPPRVAGWLKGLLTTNWAVGAVAVIIDENRSPPEILLVEHSYRVRGAWGLPGGALESHTVDPLIPESEHSRSNVLESALRREVFEELGIEIDIVHLLRIDAVPYVPEEPGPYRLDFYFRCSPTQGLDVLREGLNSGRIKPHSPEVKRIQFVPLARLDEYDLYSSDRRFLVSKEIWRQTPFFAPQ